MRAVLDRQRRAELIGFNAANRRRWVERVAAGLPPGTTVLDVGAGEAQYRTLFAHCDYRTQDFGGYEGSATGAQRESWAYADLDYVSDVTALPLPDASLEAVLCTEVLEHVPDPPAALREIARVLRPDGRAFVSAPLGSGLHQQPFHFYGGFTPHFYRRFADEAGFDVESIEPNGGFFRHLLQECSRAVALLEERGGSRRRPGVLLGRLAVNVVAPFWLTRLDDEMPIAEFTVGYHVTLRRR